MRLIIQKRHLNKGKSTSGTAGESGTGLGLLICKEFIELNSGTIKVESEVGKGSWKGKYF